MNKPQRLITVQTVRQVLTNVYNNTKISARSIDDMLNTLTAEMPFGKETRFVFKHVLVQLELLKLGNYTGPKDTYKWIGEEPNDVLAEMVTEHVFTDASDLTKPLTERKNRYLQHYKVAKVPPAAPAKKPKVRDYKLIDKYLAILNSLYSSINSSNFSMSEFCRKHKISGPNYTAINKLNVISTNYAGTQWTYPEMPNENLVNEILDMANRLQRSYGKKGEKKRKKSQVAASQKITPIRITPETLGSRIMAIIEANNLGDGFRPTDLFVGIDKKQHTSIYPELNNMAKSGKLKKVCVGYYALPTSATTAKPVITVVKSPPAPKPKEVKQVTAKVVMKQSNPLDTSEIVKALAGYSVADLQQIFKAKYDQEETETLAKLQSIRDDRTRLGI